MESLNFGLFSLTLSRYINILNLIQLVEKDYNNYFGLYECFFNI